MRGKPHGPGFAWGHEPENDERDVDEYLGLLPKRFGHEVRVTTDGTGAVAAGSSFHPDLLITDWNMPGMDGLITADRLKCKAILISAKPEAELAHNDFIVGFAE